MSISPTIRVRFAPSPTGYLHVGGLRTALYNYLFARKNNGTFVLRIEDTDRTRYVEGAVENLLKTLVWAGLEYDEGPVQDAGYKMQDSGFRLQVSGGRVSSNYQGVVEVGEYGPYIQSERLEIYKEHIHQLIEKKKAYYCFCTQERLEQLREAQQKEKLQTKYDKHCLNLSQSEIEENLEAKIPYVVRLNVEGNQTVVTDDVIRGRVEFDSNLIDDQVLVKSDGYPTYHFANVVDDHLMKITHVIRGEEWLPSTPKHALLYDAFEWEKPVFAHLPLLLNPDKSKLSKRQGDVAVEDYRSKGFLNEALVNFVALLGWNPGTEQELFSMEELVQQFSLERVHQAGAVFNLEKLNWLNFEHLRKKSDSEVLQMLKEQLAESRFKNKQFSDEYLLQVIEAMRPRMSFVKDIIEQSSYFFELPASYEEEGVKKRWKEETPSQLNRLIEEFSSLVNPTKEQYEQALHKAAESLGIGNGKLIHAVRLAVSGVSGGPGLYDMLFILGREEVIRRIETAIEKIKV
ncbi:MAG: glutamate--tRNA ligase [Bacteroidetes bacterium]|nr:MAG: glutamate--tRNA ligase [Bacteroidota bacterium]